LKANEGARLDFAKNQHKMKKLKSLIYILLQIILPELILNKAKKSILPF
ncbi:uncharacterized protein METZ01_LOCUS387581, partial [marine metagenome]